MAELSRKASLKKQLAGLEHSRQPFERYWRDLVQALDPRKADFVDQSIFSGNTHPRGSVSDRSDKEIINNRIKQARRVAVSGMFAGTISPSKPWFKIEAGNRELMKAGNVRRWLFAVEERMRRKLNAAGFYQAAVPFIRDLLDFSTAAMTDVIGPDGEPLFETHPLGTYYISQNRRGEVDTFVLRKQKNARQMFQSYVQGTDNDINILSEQVRTALNNNDFERSFAIVQFIEPNENYNEEALDSRFKKFRATTYDPDDARDDVLLEDRGFDEFPAYVPRWSTVGNEAYGTDGPGMVALGDTNQLQEQEKKKAKAIEMMVDPLLKGPPELKNLDIPNNRSNGMIVYDDLGNSLQPVYQVDPRLSELREDMLGIERRIQEAYFVDLFQAISSMEGVQPRNQEEIALRNEESLLVLGPMLERFQREFLQKVLDRNFQRMADNGEFPEPPEELAGSELDIRFISTLAQAQRSTESAILQRYLQFTGLLGQFKPEAVEKIDSDAMMDLQANLTGVNPTVIRDNEVVEAERQARAEAAQQQAQAEAAQQQSQALNQGASAVRQLTSAASEANEG